MTYKHSARVADFPHLLLVTAIFTWVFESRYVSPAVNVTSLWEVKWIVFTSIKLVFLYFTSPNLSDFTQLFIKCESHSGTCSELILAIKCLQLLIKHMIKFQVTRCEWKSNTKCSTCTLKSSPHNFEWACCKHFTDKKTLHSSTRYLKVLQHKTYKAYILQLLRASRHL